MKQFRTGVIGVGFIGAAHIEALRRLGNVQVVALCNDVDCASLAKRLYVQKAYNDYRRMIDECDLDFVHVCTPNQTHFAIASYALTHGVNVVCENRWPSPSVRRRSFVTLRGRTAAFMPSISIRAAIRWFGR